MSYTEENAFKLSKAKRQIIIDLYSSDKSRKEVQKVNRTIAHV